MEKKMQVIIDWFILRLLFFSINRWLRKEIDFAGKYYGIRRGVIFVHYEMPTVLRMCVFLVCKLSFRLLWLNNGTVRRGQMPHNACKGHWEFRYNAKFIWQPAQIHILVQLCLAGTSMYQRCLLPDEIPSAPNSPYQASALRRTVPLFWQTLERLF